MPRGFSMDLRKRVIAALKEEGSTYETVAERFAVGRATVHRWWRLHRETGDVAPKQDDGRPPRVLDKAGEDLMVGLVEDQPDATLVELADEVGQILGASISRATIGRA